jgi:hypothetical protein
VVIWAGAGDQLSATSRASTAGKETDLVLLTTLSSSEWGRSGGQGWKGAA